MSVTVGGKVSEFSSKNNQLTPQMLSTIKAMSPGQFAVFKEVQAKMVGGKSSAPVNLDGNIILEIK